MLQSKQGCQNLQAYPLIVAKSSDDIALSITRKKLLLSFFSQR